MNDPNQIPTGQPLPFLCEWCSAEHKLTIDELIATCEASGPLRCDCGARCFLAHTPITRSFMLARRGHTTGIFGDSYPTRKRRR